MSIPFRLGIQQRVFPAYRAPFFDALARACGGELSIFAGEPMADEALGLEGSLEVARRVAAKNRYYGAGPLLVVWQARILDWLEHWQPDVLITDTNPRNLSTGQAVVWMHARRRPVIGWGLGAPPYQRSLFGRALEESRRRFLRRFDALVAYSETGARQYAEQGVLPERVFLAPNAMTPRPVNPPPRRPAGYPDGRPVVLYVGRLQERKRVDALIRACARLPETLRPVLQIVGDGPAREQFEAAARDSYPEACFLGDRRGEELDQLFTRADLFVLPGTGGLAVQQAMSFALPVMVAEADGTQLNLVRPENGWLLPPQDDAALERALREALADPARLRRMGLESYRVAAEEVNLETMVGAFARAVAFAASARQMRPTRRADPAGES